MGKTAKTFAIGAVVAAAAGYVTGILTAPKSGKETRTDIKNATAKGLAEAERQLKQLHTELTALLNGARAEVDMLKGTARKDYEDAVKIAQVVREKVRDVLSAVHEGTADDKDLKKAIDDATKAVNHLKKFATNAK
jgi:gas vesicle protein